jgi:putative transposase
VRLDFIEAEKAQYPVAVLCRALGVARSGLYARRTRPESRRARENRKLLAHIRDAHLASKRRYGSPRVYFELRDRGFRIGRNRVARLMRLDGIQARHRRRFVRTTHVDPGLPVAPNVLNRSFRPDRPNAVWAADITYVRTLQGWLYLAVIMDLYSRRIVGWASGARMGRELVLNALSQAVAKRGSAAMHHSDRGSQYASWDYQRALRRLGVTCSMSRRGNCYDNAVVESFFSTLKTELVHRETFADRRQAHSALFGYIELFYNGTRRHSSLGYVSPAEFERRAEQGAVAA